MSKKLIFLLMLLFTVNAYAVISPDPYAVSSDVTIAKLNTNQSKIVNELNSLPGGNIQNLSITHGKLDANSDPVNRWDEAFNNFVFTGLLPPTSATLASTTTAGTAYVDGFRVVKAATAKTYTASRDTYVDLSSSGTYTYSEVAVGATEPAVTAASIRLAKVVTSATAVTSVLDKRVLGISLSVEDFYIKGLEIITPSPDVGIISVDAGICYVSSTRVSKTAKTTLKFSKSADWYDGSTHLGNAWCYVGIDTLGGIKLLGNNPADKNDASGNTGGGTHRYWYDSSQTKYWRVIGRVSLDSTTTNYAWSYKQVGDTIYYDNPYRIRVALGGASATFVEVTLMTTTSAMDNELQIRAYADAAAGIGFRGANSTLQSPTGTAYAGYYNGADYMNLIGWFPIQVGSSFTRAIDYSSSATVRGFINAVKITR